MATTLRAARPEDADTIAGFNVAMALETEDKALDPNVTTRGVNALLSDPGKGCYWVAEIDGRIVGQLMITYEWSDWRNGVVWWIQSVYIPPEFRRQGVFRQLYEHVRKQVQNDPEACGIRLYVEKDNHRAQATYESLGMSGDKYLVMEEML